MIILFVKPPFNPKTFIRHFMVCEPLEFEVLAAALSPSHDVHIVDLRVDRCSSLIDHIQRISPDVVAFSALTMDVNTVRRLALQVKSIDGAIVTCVGGEHASFRPEDFLEFVDYVFRFDATTTFPSFIRELEVERSLGKTLSLERVRTNPHIADQIDAIPYPRRDLCKKDLARYAYGAATPVSLIQLTAGCKYRCDFCSIPARQPRFAKRRVDLVLEDMRTTRTVDLLAIDANALQDVAWAQLLYGEIAKANLRKRLMISCRSDSIVRHPEMLELLANAGISVLSFGVESLNDAWLEKHRKHNTSDTNLQAVRLAHKAGIMVRTNFIIDQSFTRQDFARVIDAVIGASIEFPSFQILTPLPGTRFAEERKDDLITNDLDLYDLSHSVLPTTSLDLDSFHSEFQNLFRVLYGPTRLAWLATKLPLRSTAKAILGATKAHLAFSYNRQLAGNGQQWRT